MVPQEKPELARRSVPQKLLQTLFQGTASRVMIVMVDLDAECPSRRELAQLRRLVEEVGSLAFPDDTGTKLPGVVWLDLVAALALTASVSSAADQYSLKFTKSSSTMSWEPTFPGWSYKFPVTSSAADSTEAEVRLSASARMKSTLTQRDGRNLWIDVGSIGGSVNYPILGPKASIGVRGSMSTRTAALQRQKIRNQSYGFSFKYTPVQEGAFKSLHVSLIPGQITAQHTSRANLDSTIEEKGLQYNASLGVSPSRLIAGNRMKTTLRLSKSDNTLKNNKNRRESLSMSWSYKLPKDVASSLTITESRTEVGVPRSAIRENRDSLGVVVRDTTLATELKRTRNTGVHASLRFKAGRFDVSQEIKYRESLNRNTANAAQDLRNAYYGRDRASKTWEAEIKVSGKLAQKLVGNGSLRYDARDAARLSIELADGATFRDASADRRDRDLRLVGSLDWKLADDHSLMLSGQVRSIADDNPGSPELDQDTISRSARLSYSGTTSNGTSLGATVRSSFSHRVGLHAERSSNNSRTANLEIDLRSQYKRIGINLTHNFGISARRVVFDFDRQVNQNERSRKSNIRRGWTMTHSASRRFAADLTLNGRYTYSADDQGKLIVESEAQLVEQDNSTHSFNLGMTFKPASSLSVTVSSTYRLIRQWNHTYLGLREERNLRSRNEHRNLNGYIIYKPSDVNTLRMNGSRSRQRSGTFDRFLVVYARKL